MSGRGEARAAREMVEVARRADVPPGAARCVRVGGARVALFNVAGTFHAVQDACPHAQGPLSEGQVAGATLTCPWHGWSFDLRTGACHAEPLERLARYEVRLDGERVLVSTQPVD